MRCEAGKQGRPKPERLEDALAQLRADRVACHGLHDQAEHDVVRIRIRELCARLEDRRMRSTDRHQLRRRPDVAEVPVQVGLQHPLVAEVVEQAASMAEQLADGDVPAVRNQTWQPALDAVVERELPLADQLEDDGRDERLRDAADPKTIADAHRRLLRQVGIAAREAHRTTVPTDEHDHPGDARGDQILHLLPQRRRKRVSRNRGRGRARREQERRDDAGDQKTCDALRAQVTRHSLPFTPAPTRLAATAISSIVRQMTAYAPGAIRSRA